MLALAPRPACFWLGFHAGPARLAPFRRTAIAILPFDRALHLPCPCGRRGLRAGSAIRAAASSQDGTHRQTDFRWRRPRPAWTPPAPKSPRPPGLAARSSSAGSIIITAAILRRPAPPSATAGSASPRLQARSRQRRSGLEASARAPPSRPRPSSCCWSCWAACWEPSPSRCCTATPGTTSTAGSWPGPAARSSRSSSSSTAAGCRACCTRRAAARPGIATGDASAWQGRRWSCPRSSGLLPPPHRRHHHHQRFQRSSIRCAGWTGTMPTGCCRRSSWS